jgi:protein involved in polysaccharide export with SLBB domain
MKTIVQLLFISVGLAPGVAAVQAQAQAPAAAPGTVVAKPSPVLGGTFQVGDRVSIRVEGDSVLSNTYTVGPGPALVLPDIGVIALRGVRRTDVDSYLKEQLGRYLKEAIVHAKVLLRLSVIGEVEHPGFYSVAVDAALEDALMQAGGPTRDAKVTAMRIERAGGKAVLEGDSLQLALARGLTADQVGLRDGDRFVLPRLTRRDAESTWRILGILVTLPVAIYGITRITH